jgi:putative membrane protein
MIPPPGSDGPQMVPGSRRTSLAAERTWLAWWRTGLGTTAVAVGVGRLLPTFSKAERWPFTALGVAYGLLAIGIFLIGGIRQQRVSTALHEGGYDDLSSTLVTWLTAAAIVLAVGTLAVVVAF